MTEPEAITRLERLIKVGVLALVVAVPLAYGGPYFSDFFAIKFAFLLAGAGLLVGLAWVHWALTDAGRCVRSPCDWPLAICAGISLLSLTWAFNPRQGLDAWLAQAWLWALFLLVARYFRTKRAIWGVLWTIAATSFIVSAIGLLQFHGIHLIPWPHGRWGNFGVSTLGNPNFVAHYLELSVILVAGMALTRRRCAESWALVALGLFELYYLLLIRSRGGWLAVAIGLLALLLLCRLQAQFRRRVLLAAVIASPLVGLGGVLLERLPPERESGLLWQLHQFRDRVLSSFNPEHFSVMQRRLIWADTAALVADRPILGVGTGNFEFAVPVYRPATRHRAWSELIGDRPHMPYYAHNELLEIWAENGLFGLAAVLWLLGTVWWMGWRRLRAEQAHEARALQAAFLAALVAALVHSLFSFNLQDPTSGLHFWLIAGLAVGSGSGERGLAWAMGRRWWALGGIVPVALGAYWGLCILLADYYYFDGQRKYYDFHKPNRAGMAFARAAEWRGHDFRYHHMIGLVELGAQRPATAIHALERSRELHPNNAAALRLLGQALYWAARAKEASAVLSRAIELDPLDQESYVLLARVYHDRGLRHRGEGDAAAAAAAFDRAIAAWQQALAFAPESPDYLRSLGIEYFTIGRLTEAEVALARAAQLRPDDGVIQGNLGAVYLGLGQHAAAATALLRAVALDPRAEWWGNLGALYAKQSRREEAGEAYEKAIGLAPTNLRWYLPLIDLLRKQERIEDALGIAEAALEAQPQNERMARMLSELRRRLQQKGDR